MWLSRTFGEHAPTGSKAAPALLPRRNPFRRLGRNRAVPAERAPGWSRFNRVHQKCVRNQLRGSPQSGGAVCRSCAWDIGVHLPAVWRPRRNGAGCDCDVASWISHVTPAQTGKILQILWQVFGTSQTQEELLCADSRACAPCPHAFTRNHDGEEFRSGSRKITDRSRGGFPPCRLLSGRLDDGSPIALLLVALRAELAYSAPGPAGSSSPG
jgi:hypothetical protein